MDLNNISPQNFKVNKKLRNELHGHNSFVIWFTGLSGSGKSTLANLLEETLFKKKIHTYVLDGDNVRRGLNRDLGFSRGERQENLRRIAEVANFFVNAGVVVIASFISPLEKDRALVRKIIGEENFIEIFVNTSIEECERRDAKGLYKKARSGEIKNFTGISAPYEAPKHPDVEIRPEDHSLESALNKIVLIVDKKLEYNSQ